MPTLEDLIHEIIGLDLSVLTRDDVIKMKRAWAKKSGQKNVPTNIEVLKTYKKLVAEWVVTADDRIDLLLKKRSIRSQSWIVAVQVLTKPFWCPWKCIFCPTDATMPKSYINTQPWAMRALLNQFDPYKQVFNRLLSLMLTGHSTDKIEMIVLWWTRDVYPEKYKTEFIKWLYDACNHFEEFLSQIEIDYTNPKAARYTATEELKIDYPKTVQESIKRNESTKNRIIGLTVETRPEYVTDENCQFWRELGITRMEMGIQTLHNSVHEANVRGHDNEAITKAMHKLRQYWFKISNHYMPWLYTSTPEMDLETFKIAYESIAIKSDEIKFYPTAVIPNTPLYDLWKSKEYTPIESDDLAHIIREVKLKIMPPYSRIKRLARDFDTNEVVAWANTPNLRQLTMNAMEKEFYTDEKLRKIQYERLFSEATHCNSMSDLVSKISWVTFEVTTKTNCEWRKYEASDEVKTFIIWWSEDKESHRWFVCLCTRCREMRNKSQKDWWEKNTEAFFVCRAYKSTNWIEMFCSFEDQLGYLYGFTRLLLPDEWTTIDYPWLWADTAMIRELHVYWTVQSLEKKATNKDWIAQHWWFGTQLLAHAEAIAWWAWFKKLSVISGIWVRAYYVKKEYCLEWTYMVKDL